MKLYCIIGLGFQDVVTLKTKSRNLWGEISVLKGIQSPGLKTQKSSNCRNPTLSLQLRQFHCGGTEGNRQVPNRKADWSTTHLSSQLEQHQLHKEIWVILQQAVSLSLIDQQSGNYYLISTMLGQMKSFKARTFRRKISIKIKEKHL